MTAITYEEYHFHFHKALYIYFDEVGLAELPVVAYCAMSAYTSLGSSIIKENHSLN